MSPSRGQKSPQPINLRGKRLPSLGDKNPPLELNANTQYGKHWIPTYLGDLDRDGLAGYQCFQIPRREALQ